MNEEVIPDYFYSEIDDRGYLYDECRNVCFKKCMRTKPENRICMDCSARNPTWISLSYAIYLCLNCSGRHRMMGTHVSFVRSTDMDKFTAEQLLRMEMGGNGKLHQFLREHGLTENKQIDYQSNKTVRKYKTNLDKELQIVIKKYEDIPGLNVYKERTNVNEKNDNEKNNVFSDCRNYSHQPQYTPQNTQCLNSARIENQIENKIENNIENKIENRIENKYENKTENKREIHVLKSKSVGTRSGPIQARQLDIDFDFDNFTANDIHQTTFSPPKPTQEVIPHNSPKKTNELSVDRFQSAKSISSKDFAPKDEDKVIPGMMAERFYGSTSISSSAVFGRKENENSGLAKMESLKETARGGISALASASSVAVTRLGNWMTS